MESKTHMTFAEFQDMFLTIQTYCMDHDMMPPTKHWLRHTVGIKTPGYNTWTSDTGYIIEDVKKFQAAKLKYGF